MTRPAAVAVLAWVSSVASVQTPEPPGIRALASTAALGPEQIEQVLEATGERMAGKAFFMYGGFGGGVLVVGPGPRVSLSSSGRRATEYTGKPAVRCDGIPVDGELVLEWENTRAGWQATPRARADPRVHDTTLSLWSLPIDAIQDAGYREVEGRTLRGLAFPYEPPDGASFEASRQSLWFDTDTGLPVRQEIHVAAPEAIDYGYYFAYAPEWSGGPHRTLDRPDCIPGPDHYRAESEQRLSEGGDVVAKMRAVSREVAELHAFFEAWFRGELPDSDEAFSRFSNVMAPEFVLVRPDGTESRRQDLIGSLRAAHGSDPDIEIRIENESLVVDEGDLLVARYDEIQQTGGETTRRLSTVVFRIRAGTPNDLEWVRVHETWAEGSPPDPH